MIHLLNFLAGCVNWLFYRSSKRSESSLSGELQSLSHCSTPWTCSKSETGLHGIREGIHESRTGFEDRVGASGGSLPGVGLSLDHIHATRACVVHDAQPLRHARRFLASGN